MAVDLEELLLELVGLAEQPIVFCPGLQHKAILWREFMETPEQEIAVVHFEGLDKRLSIKYIQLDG